MSSVRQAPGTDKAACDCSCDDGGLCPFPKHDLTLTILSPSGCGVPAQTIAMVYHAFGGIFFPERWTGTGTVGGGTVTFEVRSSDDIMADSFGGCYAILAMVCDPLHVEYIDSNLCPAHGCHCYLDD